MTEQPRTLKDARDSVMARRWDKPGIYCPCCDQLAKVYHRKINATMARWLIALHKRHQAEPRWYRIREPWSLRILGGTGDAAKLQYWGLIEEDENDDPETKRTSGRWRPTSRGDAWVRNELSVDRITHVYNATVLGSEGPPWTVVNALGKRFRYADLMNNEEEA